MRFCYGILLFCFITLNISAEHHKNYAFKDHAGKVCLSLLATIYKHPFMTAWSIYASLPIVHADVEFLNKQQDFGAFTLKLHTRRGFLSWIVDALLVGDFAHNMLHAYGVKHTPCFKEFCINCCDARCDEEQ